GCGLMRRHRGVETSLLLALPTMERCRDSILRRRLRVARLADDRHVEAWALEPSRFHLQRAARANHEAREHEDRNGEEIDGAPEGVSAFSDVALDDLREDGEREGLDAPSRLGRRLLADPLVHAVADGGRPRCTHAALP